MVNLALQNNGITQIFSHQLEALTKLRAGFDLSITTPTASGKTLCYKLVTDTALSPLFIVAFGLSPTLLLNLEVLNSSSRLFSSSYG
ncbi:MAG: hypothetical protein PUP90_26630 [Nostoc sp. S4]|nr:hypothetical protein [Nostoc sp. S4]